MTGKTTKKFSPEVRARAVRMGSGSCERAPLALGGSDVDCGQDRLHAEKLHDWVKKAEVDSGLRAGVPTDMADKLKAPERENRELRQANEILRKASA